MENIKIQHDQFYCLPKQEQVKKLVLLLKEYFFPGFFAPLSNPSPTDEIISLLTHVITCASHVKGEEIDASNIARLFVEEFPRLNELLKQDIKATFDGDPAAIDEKEIILSYPGFFATFVYRMAHELYRLQVPYLPRMLAEYAHGNTGIDINPGATIGHSFMIDHGTGIVIGETAIIGSHVRLYQGVTLGALSLGRGQALRGTKRHPTIGDYVIIYANASILGGDTIIGEHCTIGANVYLTSSMPSYHRVHLTKMEQEIEPKRKL
ncbi:MAG: serine O-acetyltransferase [Bacilli bacterium]|jgi:serine O-acetyltransferase|nr:serine O-acetyltransferase [Bacilli bacterium]